MKTRTFTTRENRDDPRRYAIMVRLPIGESDAETRSRIITWQLWIRGELARIHAMRLPRDTVDAIRDEAGKRWDEMDESDRPDGMDRDGHAAEAVDAALSEIRTHELATMAQRVRDGYAAGENPPITSGNATDVIAL